MKKFFRILGKIISTLFKVLIVALLLMLIFVGYRLYQLYGSDLFAFREKAVEMAKASTRDDFTGGLTTVIYDVNGETIASLRSGKEAYYMDLSEVPKSALDVFIVTEDRKYYSHNGVDYVACVRALVELIRNNNKITQGASTITQQLARTVYLSNEVTMDRKLTEIFLSWELEKKYTKRDILEFYVNDIYFGNGCYGLQAASFEYFNRSAQELTLSELIFLCAIPNNPTMYNPYKFLEDTVERRDRMLKQLFDFGKINELEYQQALEEEIVLETKTGVQHNYLETFSKYCAIRALMEQDGFIFKNSFVSDAEREAYNANYDSYYDYWQQKLFLGGYRVYTSLDMDWQDKLQRAVDENTKQHDTVNDEGVFDFQASATCVDNATGLVVAIVGGRTQDLGGYTLNRAYQSFRQMGSTTKPLVVYTPMFERGISPEDIYIDERIPNGPHNASDVYQGEITVRSAVEKSLNTIAWKLYEELTPEVGISYLKKMMFRRIVPEDNVMASCLGGLTYGASSLEMASAYATIANDGVYRTATCIRRITDADGNIIVASGTKEKRVYEKNASRVMTDVLKGVLTNRGTGRNYPLETQIAAAKTGTTNNLWDSWIVGYTPYYTTAVWVGYDYPKEIEDAYTTGHPGHIWKQFMDEIHENLPVKDFITPEEIPPHIDVMG